MPNVWVVTAVIERASGERRKDSSAPTTYTRAVKEIGRLERLGVKAWMREVAALTEPERKVEPQAKAAEDRQTRFAFDRRQR